MDIHAAGVTSLEWQWASPGKPGHGYGILISLFPERALRRADLQVFGQVRKELSCLWTQEVLRHIQIQFLKTNMKKSEKFQWIYCGKYTEICKFCGSWYLLLKCPHKSCYILIKSNNFVLLWHQLKMRKIMDSEFRLQIHLGWRIFFCYFKFYFKNKEEGSLAPEVFFSIVMIFSTFLR